MKSTSPGRLSGGSGASRGAGLSEESAAARNNKESLWRQWIQTDLIFRRMRKEPHLVSLGDERASSRPPGAGLLKQRAAHGSEAKNEPLPSPCVCVCRLFFRCVPNSRLHVRVFSQAQRVSPPGHLGLTGPPAQRSSFFLLTLLASTDLFAEVIGLTTGQGGASL